MHDADGDEWMTREQAMRLIFECSAGKQFTVAGLAQQQQRGRGPAHVLMDGKAMMKRSWIDEWWKRRALPPRSPLARSANRGVIEAVISPA